MFVVRSIALLSDISNAPSPKNAYCNRGQDDRFERLGLSVLLSVGKLFSRCFHLVLMPRDILLVQEPLGVRQQVVLAIARVPIKTPMVKISISADSWKNNSIFAAVISVA